jgi:starch-binding outer membrane protein, SusD/RagB family
MKTRILALIAATGLASTACIKLEGNNLSTSPNQATSATLDQAYISVQGIGYATLTSDLAMFSNLVVQQLTGNGRQWVAYDQYNQPEDFFTVGNFYLAGGLIDIRAGQAAARAANRRPYLGILQVWEALTIGVAADTYGDLGYSEALGAAPAKLDPQQNVYAALQAMLDSAITNLGGTGLGPGSRDLNYAGNTTKWIALARTLKARLHMHTAERLGAPAYTAALAQAKLGISSAANDFNSYQSTTVGEQNRWYEFKIGRSDDVAAGRILVELMRTRNDPRLARWIEPNSTGQLRGQFPYNAPRLGEESDPSWLTDDIAGQEAPMPIATWAETRLIEAEAAYRTGDEAGARAALNVERAAVPLPAIAATVTGAALLTAIMEEKYVATFRTLESWNDYKRTCYPNITPTAGKRNVVARLPYGSAERSTNPNVPALGAQPLRNWNDPITTTSTDGTACRGQQTP